MSDALNPVGVVLAGGTSRRMGCDKALLRLQDGRTLLERTVDTLHAAGLTQVALSVSSAQRGETLQAALSSLGALTMVVDCPRDSGPLGGLSAAMAAFPGHRVLLVACDMPYLDAGALRAMLDETVPSDALVPVAAGRLQPLHAVYGPACLPAARRLLAEGRLSMRDLLETTGLQVRYLDDAWLAGRQISVTVFANVNTPAEYAALGTHIDEGAGDG